MGPVWRLLILAHAAVPTLPQILSGTGAKGCARVGTCCRRLRDLAAACGHGRSIYSSATTSTPYPAVASAVAEAIDRALAGITGTTIDFALVFVTGYPQKDRGRVLPAIRRRLPQVRLREAGALAVLCFWEWRCAAHARRRTQLSLCGLVPVRLLPQTLHRQVWAKDRIGYIAAGRGQLS